MPRSSPLLALFIFRLVSLFERVLQASLLFSTAFTHSSTVLLSSLKPNMPFILLKAEFTSFPKKPSGSTSLAIYFAPLTMPLAIRLRNLTTQVKAEPTIPP